MKHVKLTLASAITFALLGATAHADSWDLTQTATLGANTTVTQTDSSNGSVQALNAINTGATSTITGGSSQTSAMGANGLTLEQDGTTENSTQAANYAKAATIGDASGTFTQIHTDTGTVALSQTSTGNGGNTQSLNHAVATTGFTDLSQSANTANTIGLTQNTATDDNIQTVNNATGAVTGTTNQETSPASSLTLTQQGAGGNTQAANRMAAASSNVDTLIQTVTTPSVALNQTATGTSTQAANLAETADVASSDQSLSGNTIGLTQGGAGAVGNGSIQAGNYLATTGAATAIVQTVGDANNDAVTLDQNNSSTGTVQAGNLLDASAATANVTAATQAILTGSAKLTMSQDGTTAALQAGNALITGGNGSAIQEADVAELAMAQTAANNSVQAVNYAGVTN